MLPENFNPYILSIFLTQGFKIRGGGVNDNQDDDSCKLEFEVSHHRKMVNS